MYAEREPHMVPQHFKADQHHATLPARPLLKWAGSKAPLLHDLLKKLPSKYGRYVDPFFGGGALFFALNPSDAIISDNNPELINLYKQVAEHVDGVIAFLKNYSNTKQEYYAVRSLDWQELSPTEAAARTIYLNKTSLNRSYSVNNKGQFNVPFGRYKKPVSCDAEALYAASAALKKATILCTDYQKVLVEYARPGDLVFLDPPNLPVEHPHFKHHTKEHFSEADHIALAHEVERLHETGCHVVLTHSNHPLVHELYVSYAIDVIQAKRIYSRGDRHHSEDLIITIPPKRKVQILFTPAPPPPQVDLYPPTRYMGSKSKLLTQIGGIASLFRYDCVADLFAGSGIVSYMFKALGKTVISNDYMAMSATFAKAMIENNSVILPLEEAQALLIPSHKSDHFVSKTYEGLYFTDHENEVIDTLRANIRAIGCVYKQAIAMTALIRACIKKRARGIFTYTGDRYDDGRKDLKKSIEEHFLDAVTAVNNAVFDNGRVNIARNCDAMVLQIENPDMVYIDPPYYSPFSDNEYVRRYHFVEGLARNWEGVEIQHHTLTKKFKSYPTPFSTRNGAASAFDMLFRKYASSIILVSYSSNSLPTLEEMVAILARHKRHVEVIPVDYRYSFGNQGNRAEDNNQVQEFLFVGY